MDDDENQPTPPRRNTSRRLGSSHPPPTTIAGTPEPAEPPSPPPEPLELGEHHRAKDTNPFGELLSLRRRLTAPSSSSSSSSSPSPGGGLVELLAKSSDDEGDDGDGDNAGGEPRPSTSTTTGPEKIASGSRGGRPDTAEPEVPVVGHDAESRSERPRRPLLSPSEPPVGATPGNRLDCAGGGGGGGDPVGSTLLTHLPLRSILEDQSGPESPVAASPSSNGADAIEASWPSGAARRRVLTADATSRLVLVGLALFEMWHNTPPAMMSDDAVDASSPTAAPRTYLNGVMPYLGASFERNWELDMMLRSEGSQPAATTRLGEALLRLSRVVATSGLFAALSWTDITHIAFVSAFLIKCIVASLSSTYERFKPGESKKGGWYYLKFALFFLCCLVCWIVTLPLTEDCSPEDDPSSRFCFFIKTSSATLKGGEVINTTVISGPKYSVLDVLAMLAIKAYMNTRFFVKSHIKRRVKKEIRHGVVHPFRFHERLRSLLMILRWSKFLAPLAIKCNNFRKQVLDMIEKRRQRRASKAAQKKWDDVTSAIMERARAERAVLKLQRLFHEKNQYRARRKLSIISKCKKSRPSFIQRVKSNLVSEQVLFLSKLLKIQALDDQRKMRRQVSLDDKQFMTKHKRISRKQKKQLLLCPKTSFAVRWKIAPIVCVALEISQLAFAPMLSGEMKKMPLDEFISSALFASGCNKNVKKVVAPSKLKVILNIIPWILRRGGPASDAIEDNFCSASSLNQVWLVIARIIASVAVPAVSIICFLDVFITFFTGESRNGKLVTQPFFTRYVIPGIALQLIVNPTMVALSKAVKRGLDHAVHSGPSLSFHLIVACAPFASYCFDRLLDYILDFVEEQNKIVPKNPIFGYE